MRVNNAPSPLNAWKGVCSYSSTYSTTAQSLCYTAGLPSTSASYSSTSSGVNIANLGFSNLYCSGGSSNINSSTSNSGTSSSTSSCSVREDNYACSNQLVVSCAGNSAWQLGLGANNQLHVRKGTSASWQSVCAPSSTQLYAYETLYSMCFELGFTYSNGFNWPQLQVLKNAAIAPTVNKISCSSSTSSNFNSYCSIDDSSSISCIDSTASLALFCNASVAPATPEPTAAPASNVPTYRVTSDLRLEVLLPGASSYGTVCNQGMDSQYSSTRPSSRISSARNSTPIAQAQSRASRGRRRRRLSPRS